MKEEINVIAEAIYKALDELPKSWWVHGDDFLPANVVCDYAGQRKFINLIANTIRANIPTQSSILSEIRSEQEHGRQKYGRGPNDLAHDDQHSRFDGMASKNAENCWARIVCG